MLAPILTDITENQFAVQDSLTFVEEILPQSRDLDMASLDVDSLFSKIPSDETTDIYINKLFQNIETLVNGISKNDFLIY